MAKWQNGFLCVSCFQISVLFKTLFLKNQTITIQNEMGCMGHTAWAPEGRERRSQEPGRASSQKSGPGGAPRLLVEYKNDDIVI